MLVPFKNLVVKRLKKLKLDTPVKSAIICDLADKTIRGFIEKKGISLNTKTQFLKYKFKDNNLVIKGGSGILMNELKLNESLIKNAINQKITLPVVKQIIF